MPSAFGWVDFAEQDRRRMVEVIELFREQDTRDELGLGAIRDGLAERMFPGTSTIQTRARYFLFIPWIYRRREGMRTSAKEVALRVREDEIGLIRALEKGGEDQGVIGIDRREMLHRLPSSIYWAGLGRLGIRRFDGSQEQLHRAFDVLARYRRQGRDGDEDDAEAAMDGRAWDPGLPKAPRGFPYECTFSLTREEASYLAGKVEDLGPTLLGHLLAHGSLAEEAGFVWAHPDAPEFPEPFRTEVAHARCFSEASHGAALLYNLMLAEDSGRDDWIEDYREQADRWSALMNRQASAFRAWSRSEFWRLVEAAGARVGTPTRRFCDAWLDHALSSMTTELLDAAEARTLIRERERHLKRSRARLGNPRAIERWNGASGANQINYRWHRVQTIVADILRGLRN